MRDNRKKNDKPDRRRVNLHESYEVAGRDIVSMHKVVGSSEY